MSPFQARARRLYFIGRRPVPLPDGYLRSAAEDQSFGFGAQAFHDPYLFYESMLTMNSLRSKERFGSAKFYEAASGNQRL